jgi:hypothetical protein
MNSELVGEDINEVEADAIFVVLERKDELEAQGKADEVIALMDASLNELPDREEATEAERFNAVADLIAFIPKAGSNNKLVTDLLIQPLEEVSGEPKLADYVLRNKWLHDLKVEKNKLERVEWSSGRDRKFKQINKKIKQIEMQLKEMDRYVVGEDIDSNLDDEGVKESRTNQLHVFFKRVRRYLIEAEGCEPSQKRIQKEIENNYDLYDREEIIQEIDGDVIFWTSGHGNHRRFKLSSLGPTLSNLKKQEI